MQITNPNPSKLTEHDAAILAHWRAVRETAVKVCEELNAHHLKPEHDMPSFIAKCDEAIAALEAKAAEK